MAGIICLVTGGTGAGKTTFARDAASRDGGVVFSIDDWMTALFWMDSPQPIAFDWTIERIARCEAVIWTTARDITARGVPVYLDLGFTTREHRDRFVALAQDASLPVQIVYVDVPADVRWQRVQQRNADQGATFAMHVDRAMFDFMEARWEPPTDEESAATSR